MPEGREPRFRQLFRRLPRHNGSHPRRLAAVLAVSAAALAALLLTRPAPAEAGAAGRRPVVVRTSDGERVKTLDPVLAGDLASSNIVTALFDTLVQYDYVRRPYVLKPSMLTAMPRVSDNFRTYEFELRDDLLFHPDPCFDGGTRKVASSDVVFSLLRLADARMHSSSYWLLRGKIVGLDEFYSKTAALPEGDYSCYDHPPAGLEIIDDRRFAIHLTRPDPRFIYMLAMPGCAVVSRRAVEHYGSDFAWHPIGSGPFTLADWQRDHHIFFDRFPEFREEYFPEAADPADRARRLPLADRLECYCIRQAFSSWMLFLQGKLDISRLDKDNLDVVLSRSGAIAPALAGRGITLLRQPGFEIQYIGYNFDDPKLGGNIALRRAINLAFNLESRIEHSNMQMEPAPGPLPPGVAGFDPAMRNPFNRLDLDEAKLQLALAGYPGGLDPATGKPLELTFDLNGNSPLHRQLGELMAVDLRKIGIEVKVVLNNSPLFFQKLKRGELQLFRLSWAGDYPDAENFLQLFYSGNANGGCNRTNFRDPEFDAMYRQCLTMADSPERTALYKKMVALLLEKQPWIFESYPIRFRLEYPWLRNYLECDFDFVRWKYLTADPAMREAETAKFKPLSFSELNAE